MGLEFNNKLETFEQLNDTIESFENIKSLPAIESPQTLAEAVSIPETAEGKNLSTESIDRLESYVGFEPFECLNDAVVTEQIAEYLSGLESLKYENWKKLSLEERRELLNVIENKIAQIEHRPPVPIKVEKMAPRTFGYQDSYNNIIALNSKYVMSDSKESYRDVIDTIIHEGRHAYQHYNVEKKCIHDSLSVVNT